METPQFEMATKRIAKDFLSNLDDFFELTNREWNETMLLRAAGMDHRFIYRVRKGESFTTGKVDDLLATMNHILKGEIKPDAFRGGKRKGA